MKKFFLILTAILLTSAIIGSVYYIRIQDNSNHQDLSVADVFNSSGAKMVVNELYFFVRAGDEFKSLDSLTAVCQEIFKALEIDNYSKSTSSTDILVKSDLSGITKNGVKVIAMSSIVGNKSGRGDKYITIDATETKDGTALLLRDKIEAVFKKYNMVPVVNSSITGTYEGNLQDTQLEKICRNILKEGNAKKVDSMRQENLINVSAFSPVMKDKLSINGKNVNLSLSIRYNKLENKTYLWVATPIVNTEY